MKINELSKLTGFSVPTLRYYEDLGLLKPKRLGNNYRDYSEADVNWINFIKRAKMTGMTLATMKNYSDLREQGNSTIPERIKILEAQTKILQEKKCELDSHLEFLADKKRFYEDYLKL